MKYSIMESDSFLPASLKNYREEFLSSAFIIIDHTVCDKFHTA